MITSFSARVFACIASCLLLTSCFLTPGEFEADLTLNEDGSYRFAYQGQIQLILPEREFRKPSLPPFNPEAVYCESRIDNETGEETPITSRNVTVEVETVDATTETRRPALQYSYKQRDCTSEEVAEKRTEHEQRNAKRMAEYEQRIRALTSIFGGAFPGNDESMEKLAKKLESYAGWNSVVYQGDDTFLVDYTAEGEVSAGFVFPQLPDTSLNMPFVQIIPRKNATYEIIAPAFGGGGSVATLSKLDRSVMRGVEGQVLIVPSGSFTIRTNGDVLANNSDAGLVREDGGTVIRWNVTEGLESPRALIGPAR